MTMKAYPSLATPRLLLREAYHDDAQIMYTLLQDPDVTVTLVTIPDAPTLGHIQTMIAYGQECFEHWGDLMFSVLRQSDHRFLGSVSLAVTPDHDRGTLRYWFGKDYWGYGYATEAVSAVVRCGFEQGLNKITARCIAWNNASVEVLLNIRMTQEGYLRSHVKKRDRWEDVKVFGLLRSEFEFQA